MTNIILENRDFIHDLYKSDVKRKCSCVIVAIMTAKKTELFCSFHWDLTAWILLKSLNHNIRNIFTSNR